MATTQTGGTLAHAWCSGYNFEPAVGARNADGLLRRDTRSCWSSIAGGVQAFGEAAKRARCKLEFDLPARFIIHAVGPRRDQAGTQLSFRYRRALDLAVSKGLQSVVPLA